MTKEQSQLLKYFMERTAEDFAEMKNAQAEIRKDVSDLKSFKLKLLGASAVISAVAGIAIEVVMSFVKH